MNMEPTCAIFLTFRGSSIQRPPFVIQDPLILPRDTLELEKYQPYAMVAFFGRFFRSSDIWSPPV